MNSLPILTPIGEVDGLVVIVGCETHPVVADKMLSMPEESIST